MLEAYCWPRSVAQGQHVELHVSTDVASFDINIIKDDGASAPVSSEVGHAQPYETPEDTSSHGCRWPTSYRDPCGELAQWLLRGHDHFGRRSIRRVLRRPARSGRPGADPAGPLDQHVRRLQRLGRPVAVHRRHPRVGRAPAGARASWSSRSRTVARCSPSPTARVCGSSGGPSRSACRCGAAAPAGGTGSDRSSTGPTANGYRLDVAISTDLEQHPEVLDGHRLFVCVGHDEYWSWGMRDALDAHTAAGGNAAILSGNTCCWQVRFEDDHRAMTSLQVPGRRGPRRRNPAGAPAERGVVGSPDRAAGDLDDRPHVLARRVLTLRPRRAARLRRVHRAPARPLALRGHRPALRRRASAWPTRSSPTRSTAAS